jgi:hypothetical protein
MKTNGLVNLVSKEDVKNIFLEFHESKLIKGDRELDEILGTRSKDNEKDIDRDWLISEYGMEQYLYERRSRRPLFLFPLIFIYKKT